MLLLQLVYSVLMSCTIKTFRSFRCLWKKKFYACEGTADILAAIDCKNNPSESIIMWWFGAQETFIFNVEHFVERII